MQHYRVYDEITEEMLEMWFKLEKNVIFVGDHGVGKTTIIKNFWDKKKLKSVMFSGSTLDPWVDLIGVPRLVEENGEKVMELVRPKNIATDIEAIFVDEYNRSHQKVRNALMELKQFKSINGRCFPNLKFVWAAANPPDTDNNYDVEEIDPAQLDRFHIIVKLANKINLPYFTQKYGAKTAKAADKWFSALGEQKKLVSPRRVDYAIEYFLAGGDIREVIPDKNINITTLIKSIKETDQFDKFKEAVYNKNKKLIKLMVFDQKIFQSILPECYGDSLCCEAIINVVDPELMMALSIENEGFGFLVARASKINPEIVKAIEDCQKASGHYPSWYRSAMDKNISSRAGLDIFERIISSKTTSNEVLEIGNILAKVSGFPVEEIIDDINLSKDELISLSESSSHNFLTFANSLYFGSFSNIKKYGSTNNQFLSKFSNLFVSSLNYFYIRDANLDAVEFSYPGLLDLLKSFSVSPSDATKGNKKQKLFEVIL